MEQQKWSNKKTHLHKYRINPNNLTIFIFGRFCLEFHVNSTRFDLWQISSHSETQFQCFKNAETSLIINNDALYVVELVKSALLLHILMKCIFVVEYGLIRVFYAKLMKNKTSMKIEIYANMITFFGPHTQFAPNRVC